jgi:hypothetical protein
MMIAAARPRVMTRGKALAWPADRFALGYEAWPSSLPWSVIHSEIAIAVARACDEWAGGSKGEVLTAMGAALLKGDPHRPDLGFDVLFDLSRACCRLHTCRAAPVPYVYQRYLL